MRLLCKKLLAELCSALTPAFIFSNFDDFWRRHIPWGGCQAPHTLLSAQRHFPGGCHHPLPRHFGYFTSLQPPEGLRHLKPSKLQVMLAAKPSSPSSTMGFHLEKAIRLVHPSPMPQQLRGMRAWERLYLLTPFVSAQIEMQIYPRRSVCTGRAPLVWLNHPACPYPSSAWELGHSSTFLIWPRPQWRLLIGLWLRVRQS